MLQRDPILCLLSFLKLNIPGRNGKGDILSCHLKQKKRKRVQQSNNNTFDYLYVEETVGPWLYAAALMYVSMANSSSHKVKCIFLQMASRWPCMYRVKL